MTIEELTEALNKIPANSAINRAARRAILVRIFEMMETQEEDNPLA